MQSQKRVRRLGRWSTDAGSVGRTAPKPSSHQTFRGIAFVETLWSYVVYPPLCEPLHCSFDTPLNKAINASGALLIVEIGRTL